MILVQLVCLAWHRATTTDVHLDNFFLIESSLREQHMTQMSMCKRHFRGFLNLSVKVKEITIFYCSPRRKLV